MYCIVLQYYCNALHSVVLHWIFTCCQGFTTFTARLLLYTQPCHTYTILTHSIGKLIIAILPTFPREIHGYSPHQPHLGKAKASNMLPLREEFYSCPEKYNPNHVESVTQTYFKGAFAVLSQFCAKQKASVKLRR